MLYTVNFWFLSYNFHESSIIIWPQTKLLEFDDILRSECAATHQEASLEEIFITHFNLKIFFNDFFNDFCERTFLIIT